MNAMRRRLEGWRRLPVRVRRRLVSLAVATPTGAVLALATWLEPSPEGHSTHTQLGLDRCSFLSLTGHPCPMCGATTTFTLMAHLRPVDAVLNQPFAAVLFLVTLGLFAVALLELARPRGRWDALISALAPWEGAIAAGALALMALGWAYKIWLMWGVA